MSDDEIAALRSQVEDVRNIVTAVQMSAFGIGRDHERADDRDVADNRAHIAGLA